MVAVIAVDPLESVPAVIDFPKRTVPEIKFIKCADIVLKSFMLFKLQKMPLQLFRKAPFDKLSELSAHEQKLFARHRHIVSQKCAV